MRGYDNKYSHARDVLKSFNRWPTWMWANEEIIDLVEWLKEYNMGLSHDRKVGRLA